MEEFAESSPISKPSNTLTAFYEDRGVAEGAVERLVEAGIGRDSIRLVEGNDTEADREVGISDDGKGFWEALSDFLFPSKDRAAYSEGLRRGGYLVTVTGVSADLADTALDILDDEGSIDIDERAASWRSEGWSADEEFVPTEYDRTGDPKISGVPGAAGFAGTESDLDNEAIRDVEENEDERAVKRDMTNARLRARSYNAG
ncbi:hypothetical protein [Phyllobacterium bourgognense]|uniref:General stress protein 17M-like domain-containing protein n=1 Tax=Phyllobacterium bourgognense TaxID=314236 RepID=A0A368YHD5_9HYPH|nr:hypothetical protein [Phyllobacterium bourgognense]RCW77584.1 hypothetical protein C7476_1449 [Phyllobacterium bourgognense]